MAISPESREEFAFSLREGLRQLPDFPQHRIEEAVELALEQCCDDDYGFSVDIDTVTDEIQIVRKIAPPSITIIEPQPDGSVVVASTSPERLEEIRQIMEEACGVPISGDGCQCPQCQEEARRRAEEAAQSRNSDEFLGKWFECSRRGPSDIPPSNN